MRLAGGSSFGSLWSSCCPLRFSQAHVRSGSGGMPRHQVAGDRRQNAVPFTMLFVRSTHGQEAAVDGPAPRRGSAVLGGSSLGRGGARVARLVAPIRGAHLPEAEQLGPYLPRVYTPSIPTPHAATKLAWHCTGPDAIHREPYTGFARGFGCDIFAIFVSKVRYPLEGCDQNSGANDIWCRGLPQPGRAGGGQRRARSCGVIVYAATNAH